MRFSRNSCGRTRSTSGLVEIVSPVPGLYRWSSSDILVLPVDFHRFRQIPVVYRLCRRRFHRVAPHRRFWSHCATTTIRPAAGFAGPRSRRQRVVEPPPTDTRPAGPLYRQSFADRRRSNVFRARTCRSRRRYGRRRRNFGRGKIRRTRKNLRTRRLESVSGRARSRADVERVARGDVSVASQ